jgi:DNA replication protein DnaC
MEHISNKLERLARRLNLIDENQVPEPYLLTKEEEDKLIAHEIDAEKKYVKWKMEQVSMLKDQIDAKMAEIKWEDRIDRQAILQRANSVKNHDIWLEEKHKKDKQEEERVAKELQEHWNAKAMYNLMAWTSQNVFNKKLIVNNDNKGLITALCFFLSNDKRFETDFDPKLKYSLKKGLLIRGISGIGKTHLVRCVEDNQLNPILTLSMVDVTDELRAYGEYDIELNGKKVIYLDDVGTEQTPIVHFGTHIHFFKNLIESIYHRNVNNGFRFLIISTNLSFQQISEKYGFRVASRMRDMFNVIDVTGKDMRGNG